MRRRPSLSVDDAYVEFLRVRSQVTFCRPRADRNVEFLAELSFRSAKAAVAEFWQLRNRPAPFAASGNGERLQRGFLEWLRDKEGNVPGRIPSSASYVPDDNAFARYIPDRPDPGHLDSLADGNQWQLLLLLRNRALSEQAPRPERATDAHELAQAREWTQRREKMVFEHHSSSKVVEAVASVMADLPEVWWRPSAVKQAW